MAKDYIALATVIKIYVVGEIIGASMKQLYYIQLILRFGGTV